MAGTNGDINCHLKQYRLSRGWSQEELAELIHVRRQAVYDIESGRYLPNTAIALKLARVFGCRVEDLFVERNLPDIQPVQLVQESAGGSPRLALGRVGDRLIGYPLNGPEAAPFGLRPADGLLAGDGQRAQILLSPERLAQTIFLMGCDPAFEILGHHVSRTSPEARVHCRFASSHRALDALSDGLTHVAGTHLHNTDNEEANVALAGRKLSRVGSRLVGFSLLEEGLMVARGNPLALRTAADLAQPKVRFVNRDRGAALRVLLDDQLRRAGVDPEAISGYADEVSSHREGAYRIACNVADAALGFRAVAETYGLGFVPIAAARCDLVVPDDTSGHPTVKILLDVLQSAALRRDIEALPGYDGSVTGKLIAELPPRTPCH